MVNRRLAALAATLGLALFCGGCGQEGARAEPSTSHASIGLFSSLPIYWGEGDGVAAVLNGGAQPGWVRRLLEQHGKVVPLDALESSNLDDVGELVMAQPRPLAPSENVALDKWVRDGGRLLLFADPMLTRHSDYALGDKRRPQDMVLISPILNRWGLELRFDEEQVDGERMVGTMPVNLAGQFALAKTGEGAICALSDDGLIARCSIGRGRVTLVADAAMLDDEPEASEPPMRSATLDRLLAESLSN